MPRLCSSAVSTRSFAGIPRLCPSAVSTRSLARIRISCFDEELSTIPRLCSSAVSTRSLARIRRICSSAVSTRSLARIRRIGVEAAAKNMMGDQKERQPQRQLWLLKTEPDVWSWQNQRENSGLSVWDGVRNALAQKHMKSMSVGDLCLFYHTGKAKEVVGIVRVLRTLYPDPTDETGKWGAVDVQEVEALKQAVTLAQMKHDDRFEGFLMLRQPRLSVVPVDESVWERVCELGLGLPSAERVGAEENGRSGEGSVKTKMKVEAGRTEEGVQVFTRRRKESTTGNGTVAMEGAEGGRARKRRAKENGQSIEGSVKTKKKVEAGKTEEGVKVFTRRSKQSTTGNGTVAMERAEGGRARKRRAKEDHGAPKSYAKDGSEVEEAPTGLRTARSRKKKPS